MSSIISNPVECLCRTIRNGDRNQVEQLLDHGIDINACDSVGDLAIDVAWRLKKYDLIELLLNHDSRFPTGFNHAITARLKAIVSERQELHDAVGKGDIAQVQAFLNRRPHLKLWLNTDNESLCHCAIRMNRIQIYALLASRRCEFRNEEERSCLYHLTPVQEHHLRRKQHKYLQGCGAAHLAYLQIRTKNPRKDKELDSEVKVLYAKLNAFDFMSPILKVIETSTHFTIYFDQGRSNLRYAENHSVVNLSSQILVIRGKLGSIKTLGILAYHLCFLSFHLVYGNSGKPYTHDESDSEKARRYRDILSRVRQRQHELHPILQDVFQNNVGEEVICRVPQMLIVYEGDCAENDSKKGEAFLVKQIPELLEFFMECVLCGLMPYIKQYDSNREAERINSENTRLGQVTRVEDVSLDMENTFNVADIAQYRLLIAVSINLIVAEATVYTAVKNTGEPFLFLETSQWSDSVQEVLTRNACTFVLLVCQSMDADKVRDILTFLSHLSEVTEATVVLIAECHQKTYLEESVKASSLFSSRYAVINCSDRNPDSIRETLTDSLLKSTIISFQGTQELPLQRVIDSFWLSQVIDTKALEDIGDGKAISIGPPLIKCEQADYFIERKFERRIRIEKFTSIPNDVFAFLGCTEETVTEILPPGTRAHCFRDLEEFEKFVLVADSNEYEELVKSTKYENKVVHLVERVGSNVFLWRTSNGPTSRLRKCVSASNAVRCAELAILLETKEKAVVVCGAPGLGKTTTASHLPAEMKKINERAWVFYVNLPEQIGSMNTQPSSNIFQKLSALCGVQEAGLTYALFKESLERSRPFEVAVILDAFDEICQDYRSDVLRLCVDLKKTCSFKLIVFSRNVWKPLLEDTFGTIAFEMLPFNQQDQITFLQRYWQRRAPHVDVVAEEHVASCAKRILECFPVCYATGEMRSLAEVPLLLRLVAEIEEKTVLSGKTLDESHFKKLTMLDIYIRFFRHKYRVCKARWESEQIQSGKAGDQDKLRRGFVEDMHLHAFRSTLQDERLLDLFTESKSAHPLYEDDEGISKCDALRGLVGGETTDLPVFEHKTIAEFLTATWLFNKTKSTSSMQNKVRHTILDLYRFTDYQIIRYFFDSLALSRYPFHVAVMNSDIGYIRKQLTPDSIDAFDDFGRTPLHIAVLYADEHIVSRLTHECSWDATKITDKFGFTPVMYADKFRSWAKLSSMCASYNVLDSHVAFTMQTALHNASNERRLEMSVFCEAVVKDMAEFLGLLLSHFEGRLDDIKDKEKRTLLFYVNKSATLSILCRHSDSYKSCDINAQDVEGCTPLHHAVLINKLDVVTGLCLMGAEINTKNHRGETPLSVAARCGFFDITSYLISFGADVNALDTRLNTALHAACQYRHMKCVKLLLDSGIDTTQRNVWGLAAAELLNDEDVKTLNILTYTGGRRSQAMRKTVSVTVQENVYKRRHSSDSETRHATLEGRVHAELAFNSDLHAVILSGSFDVHKIDQLIQRQTDLNVTNCYGETPLLLACARGCDVFVQRLLEYNASANMSDHKGTLPLHAAAKSGQLSVNTYNMLIEHSRDINSVDREGRSALVIACEHGRSHVVQCLLESNADANITGRKGRLPLHQAAKFGKLPEDCLRVLARHTVDVNAADNDGETALHLAIEARHNPVVICLLEENARANIPDKTGKLALHRAVCANVEEKTFGLIISHTDDINHRDIDGRSALHEAAWCRNPTAIIMLLRAGAQANVKDRFGCVPLHSACESDLTDRYCFLALIESTGDFNEYDDTGFTPLMYACYERNSKPIQWLLENGAQVNDRGRPFNPLSIAYQSSLSEDDLLLLIERLDDVNKKVYMSRTALFNACHSGHLKTVRFLLSKGADVNVTDEDGRTPLHQSALRGHANIVKLLLPHAEAHARDKYDRTPWDLAKKKGNMNIVRAIEACWGKPPPGKALVA